MNVTKLELDGVLLIEPLLLPDTRGFFFESYHSQRYAEAGLPSRFVQDNHSCSAPGTLRGLHYQLLRPQGKLVRVIRGAIFDVAADVRRGSPTFGRWLGVTLSAENKLQLYVPPGFAHGFCVLDDTSEVLYKCTDFHTADDQRGVRWDDPALAITWPISSPVMSAKDRALEILSPNRRDLPVYP